MSQTILLIAHGSREEESNQALFLLLEKFRTENPDKNVFGAFLELASPSIPEGIELCVVSGAREIFVVPLMLFPGRHVKKDIPVFIKEAEKKYPGIVFHYGGPFADKLSQKELIDFLKRKIATMR